MLTACAPGRRNFVAYNGGSNEKDNVARNPHRLLGGGCLSEYQETKTEERKHATFFAEGRDGGGSGMPDPGGCAGRSARGRTNTCRPRGGEHNPDSARVVASSHRTSGGQLEAHALRRRPARQCVRDRYS